ncbi:hypothetical protein F0U44_16990 [Nocardioides humilatus]|uniref:Uncharacterized protein n=1 Tax=Nocardioides humilatus TaxID=2607660 RepID=A0A5B1L8C9_9ACTN|nr:hypothetical protein [Nocardioides humilatus]KAA1416882.1 hypothetical protein F0U44_16990 [Nocardioides humilatus]
METETRAAAATDDKPMTLGEWISAAGFILAFYVLIGLFWADGHADTVHAIGIEKMATYALHVAAWPALIFFDFDVFGIHLT